MSYSQTPITAQIKHSTKGGMKTTQPLLNMGAPVQMNMPGSQDSPGKNTKQDPYKTNQRGYSSYSIEKDKKTVEDYESYNPKKHSKVRNFFKSIAPSRAKDRLNTLNSAKSTTETKTNKYKSGQGVLKNQPQSSAGNFEPANPSNTDPVPFAFRKDNKIGGGSHSGVKGKMGSDTRKAEYDKRGWAYDETISKASVEKANSRPKAKVVNTIKSKGVENVQAKKETIKTTPKVTNTVKTAKAIKKNTAGTRKSAKANKKQKQADAAIASGNTRKANRKQKAADRKTAKAKKKFSQAAEAVNPK